MLPTDPIILLSYVNTQLRDSCVSLAEFCEDQGVEPESVIEKLRAVGYEYSEAEKRFI